MRPHKLIAVPMLLLTLLCSACGNTPVLDHVSGPVPAVSPAEAELFRCSPAPTLGSTDPAYDALLAYTLQLRADYATCLDKDSRLVDLATRHAK